MTYNKKECHDQCKFKKPLLYALVFCLIFATIFFNQKIIKKVLSISFIEKKLSGNIPDKIWLHRCDSQKRLETFHAKFHGVEIDIIYHDKLKLFESSHDPDDPNTYDLEKIFKYYGTNNLKNKIWLDFKNLTVQNSTESESALTLLMQKHNIRKRDVIVESKDWVALKHYKDRGYKTSYYFPYFPTEELDDTLKRKVEAILKTGNVDYISFYHEYYNFIKEINIPTNIKMLTWVDGSNWYEIVYLDKFRKIFNDKDIVVILTREKDHFR